MPRDKRYPTNWPKISKRQIARVQKRCEECGIEEATIVRRRRVRGRGPETVSEEEYVALRNRYRLEQAALRDEQREQMIEDERQYSTPERRTDLALRALLADKYKNVPGVTVMRDPDERYGFYSEGDYHSYSDSVDDDHTDSEHTCLLRELSALGLTRIKLQTNHIDGNPSNCDKSNLEVLCQFCHGPKPPNRKRTKATKRRAMKKTLTFDSLSADATGQSAKDERSRTSSKG